jgi:hypothetical protein
MFTSTDSVLTMPVFMAVASSDLGEEASSVSGTLSDGSLDQT